ncbi:Protein MAINTENANCE OF MERISTEMS [Bienertia sinuspersici]
MPFGEMTIMLHDVAFILGLPIEGNMVSGTSDDALTHICGLLGVTETDLVEKNLYIGGGIHCDSIIKACRDEDDRAPETRAIGFLLVTLGSTLFVDKSGSRVRPANVLELVDLEIVRRYAWGTATLAYLYRQLGVASRNGCRALSGCMTLLQAWIYEYFPCFRPHRERLVILPDAPRAAQWDVLCEPKSMERLYSFRARLDSLTADEVMWLPYGQQPYEAHPRTLMTGFISHHGVIEPYLPERCLRQLGFQQIIPQKIPQPLRVYRGEDPKAYTVVWPDRVDEMCWSMFPRGFSLLASQFTPAVPRSASTADYIGWYQTFSHPWIVNDRDVVQPYGPDATVGEYWMAEFSQKDGFIFDPIVDQLPQEFVRIKEGLYDMRKLVKRFDDSLGFQRPPNPPSAE